MISHHKTVKWSLNAEKKSCQISFLFSCRGKTNKDEQDPLLPFQYRPDQSKQIDWDAVRAQPRSWVEDSLAYKTAVNLKKRKSEENLEEEEEEIKKKISGFIKGKKFLFWIFSFSFLFNRWLEEQTAQLASLGELQAMPWFWSRNRVRKNRCPETHQYHEPCESLGQAIRLNQQKKESALWIFSCGPWSSIERVHLMLATPQALNLNNIKSFFYQ